MTEQGISELTPDELDGLIQRTREAIEQDLALSQDDIRLLLSALLTLATMQERLSDKDVTLHKMRKLLGMVQSSEKLKNLLDKPSVKKTKTKSAKPKAKTPPPEKVFHNLSGLQKGDVCPECKTGKVYKYEPAEILRIAGHSPFKAEQHICERLRCNACGAYFTAALPKDLLNDGEAGQKYGYSARSLMVLQKYFAGAPFYRQESLQNLLGLSISASTIFDQCEQVGNVIAPVFNTLKTLSADAHHFYLDDTTARILNQQAIEKPVRGKKDKTQTRTGVYASGLIASTEDEHDVVLFQTNIGHAGEWIDEILKQRASDKPPPIIMSDALSSNNPTVCSALQAACNAHGRRNFADIIHQYPDEVDWVLNRYKTIWEMEADCVENSRTPKDRLEYHRQHSLPVMQAIRDWGQRQFEEQKVEENSSLGKAIAYFHRHFERLTLFCKVENAQLDNNIMEQALKLIIRNRKNAYFYKTLAGAAIADVLTSCIATAQKAGINVFDYLNAIQRNQKSVKNNPENWLPWNYQQNTTP